MKAPRAGRPAAVPVERENRRQGICQRACARAQLTVLQRSRKLQTRRRRVLDIFRNVDAGRLDGSFACTEQAEKPVPRRLRRFERVWHERLSRDGFEWDCNDK